MALIKCKECNREVSSKADVCPGCGARIKAKPAGCGAVLAIIALAVFAFVAIVANNLPDTRPRTGTPDASSPVAQPAPPETFLTAIERAEQAKNYIEAERQAKGFIAIHPTHPQAAAIKEKQSAWAPMLADQLVAIIAEQHQKDLKAKWSYSETVDSMTGKPNRTASIRSENTVNFDFPYSGPQRATLILRAHPQHGKDVIFRIEKGQLLCGFDRCNVAIRFDEEKAQTFNASPPSDHSTEVLFITNYEAFVRGLKRAKIVRIQVTAHQEGNPVFEFATSGIDHKKIP